MKGWTFPHAGLEAETLGSLTKRKQVVSGKVSPPEMQGCLPIADYLATPKILLLPLLLAPPASLLR